MSLNESADEQSEDGELRQSPVDRGQDKSEAMDFSLSEDEGETVDSLDIKPPQAQIASQNNRSKRRAGHDRHHKRSERQREERGHSHRPKHHSTEETVKIVNKPKNGSSVIEDISIGQTPRTRSKKIAEAAESKTENVKYEGTRSGGSRKDPSKPPTGATQKADSALCTSSKIEEAAQGAEKFDEILAPAELVENDAFLEGARKVKVSEQSLLPKPALKDENIIEECAPSKKLEKVNEGMKEHEEQSKSTRKGKRKNVKDEANKKVNGLKSEARVEEIGKNHSKDRSTTPQSSLTGKAQGNGEPVPKAEEDAPAFVEGTELRRSGVANSKLDSSADADKGSNEKGTRNLKRTRKSSQSSEDRASEENETKDVKRTRKSSNSDKDIATENTTSRTRSKSIEDSASTPAASRTMQSIGKEAQITEGEDKSAKRGKSARNKKALLLQNWLPLKNRKNLIQTRAPIERKERDHQRDKERYYREKYAEAYTEYITERVYRDRKDESSTRSRHTELRKYHEKKERETHERYIETEKYKREKHEDDRRDNKSVGDKTLQDLRERLLSKRGNKGDDDYKSDKSETHKDKRSKEYESLDSVLQGEAGMYVKEIINISTEDRRYRKEHREDEKLTEEEKAEQEMRREKLLEAEREMARQKEQSRLERERRHVEKQAAKRKLEEEVASNKRLHLEESNIVTVSDNSEEDMDKEEIEDEEKSDRSDVSELESSSNDSRLSHHSLSTRSGDVSPRSDRNSRSHSSERSRSPSRSHSSSPIRNGNEQTEERSPEKEIVPKIDEDLPAYYPAIQGCRSVEEFQCLNRIEEGTYGVVYRARDKRTEEIVALKRLKMEKEKEGFPITSLREINTLLKGQHPNIVTVREIVVGSNMDKIFIVMDYVEHDLKSLMETMRHKKQGFTPGEVKCLLKQLLAAVAHLHDNWILHRDLKTSNLLLSHKGILKVGDFGLAREYGSPLKAYTPIVVTLWYRAPELLLCTKEYSTPIDMWSVGCIFAELLLMNALFPGKSEVDQLNRIFKDLGTPNEKIWPGFKQLPAVQKMKFTDYAVSNVRTRFSMLSELGLSMLGKFLTYDPQQRVTAEEAMKHSYFDEAPLPIDPAMFPTWPAKSELGHRRALAASPKPPSGGREYKQLGGDGDDDGYGFRIGISAADSRRLAMGGGFSLKF